MAELIEHIVSWPTFLCAVVVFSLVPGVVLYFAVILYPRDHPRRRKMVDDLATVPRWERPFWVTEQLVIAIFEGVPLRAKAAREARRTSSGGTADPTDRPSFAGLFLRCIAMAVITVGVIAPVGIYEANPDGIRSAWVRVVVWECLGSVEAAARVRVRHERAEWALLKGYITTTSRDLDASQRELSNVCPEDGREDLVRKQAVLTDRVASR